VGFTRSTVLMWGLPMSTGLMLDLPMSTGLMLDLLDLQGYCWIGKPHINTVNLVNPTLTL
jgi:hypothetical protein